MIWMDFVYWLNWIIRNWRYLYGRVKIGDAIQRNRGNFWMRLFNIIMLAMRQRRFNWLKKVESNYQRNLWVVFLEEYGRESMEGSKSGSVLINDNILLFNILIINIDEEYILICFIIISKTLTVINLFQNISNKKSFYQYLIFSNHR